MTPQQILDRLTVGLKDFGFAVHGNDDHLPAPASFPGDAIAYIFHDHVELYLIDGSLKDGLNPEIAADLAAKAITAAGLYAGEDPATWLINGRVTVTAA
ncbi:hypothetical protein [Nonomuraea sp. NPDC049646]|uniref:hypothetical protein n=1 Tax=unclassified Nonomuraea TaxID=2593643 RepID=UPI0037AE4155